MPGTILPELDQVFAKWEKRGGPQQGSNPPTATYRQNGDHMLEKGRQKWREKYQGQNIQPLKRRAGGGGGRERRPRVQIAVPAETIQMQRIAQFKSTPTILPEHYITSRPFMGSTCSCMPMSQKDIITSTTTTDGMRNILDIRHELRGSGLLARQFDTLVYAWRARTHHKYPDLSMAVLTSQRVRDIINQELLAEEVKLDQKQLEKRAWQILNKMKNKVSNTLTRFTGYFLHHFLPLMLSGVHVHRGQMKMVKTAVERDLPVLYLPLHRSHLDYILITFILWNYDIRNPQIAAGDNLNIFLFTMLIKGLGGFFIRRKLDKGKKKDSMYRTILHTYVEQSLMNGESLEFFLEGGRSRTGKSLNPKGGLLSVVVDCLTQGVVEDVYVVPVSISYEKILDGNFRKEQMGVPKKGESFFNAMRAIWNVVRGFYGSVRVDFAQPFSLKECLHAIQPPSPPSPDSSGSDISGTSPPSEFLQRNASTTSLYGTDVVVESQRQLVNQLGSHIIYSCTNMTAMMSTHLLAFLLLTKHRQGTSLSQLTTDFTWLREEVVVRKRDLGFSPSSQTPGVLQYAINLLGPSLVTKSKSDEGTEMITPIISIPAVYELSYYSNHMISVFLLESIVVSAVVHLSDLQVTMLDSVMEGEVILMSREEVLEVAQELCTLLQYEFIFTPPCCSLEDSLADTLDHLITSEVLRVEDSHEYDNTLDRQWASRLSASLSWAEEGEDAEEEAYRSEQFIRVNLELDSSRQKLKFFHSILAPFFEAYLVTGHQVKEVMKVEIPEDDFIRQVHQYAKDRVLQEVASYGESAALETLKNAVRAYKQIRILDSYRASNLCMLELHGRYDVVERLNHLLAMLESLR